MHVIVGPERRLNAKELMLLNCGAGEDSWESLGLWDQTSQSWKKWTWIFIWRTVAEAGHLMWRANSLEKTLMLGRIEGKRRRGRQRMKQLDNITQWTWIWANSRRWWRTGRPGLLLFVGLQRVWPDWATEHQQQSKSSDRLYFPGLQNHCRG